MMVTADVDQLWPYGAALVRGATRAAADAGLHVTMRCPVGAAAGRAAPILSPAELDGVIAQSSMASDPWLAELAAACVPMVFIGRWPGAPARVQVIDSDHESGTERLMVHLAGLGRHRVAVITGPFDIFDVILRHDVYERMRGELSLDRDPTLLATGDFSARSGYDAMRSLLHRPSATRPDAVFAMNDEMAIGAIRAITDAGLRVPDDIAVAGFDGQHEPMSGPMSLTSVRQDVSALTTRAVRALVDLIAGVQPGEPEIVPVELVIGESTIGRPGGVSGHRVGG